MAAQYVLGAVVSIGIYFEATNKTVLHTAFLVTPVLCLAMVYGLLCRKRFAWTYTVKGPVFPGTIFLRPDIKAYFNIDESPMPEGHLPTGMIPTVSITKEDYQRLLPYNDTDAMLDEGASYRISLSEHTNEPGRQEPLYLMAVFYGVKAANPKPMPSAEALFVLELIRRGGLST